MLRQHLGGHGFLENRRVQQGEPAQGVTLAPPLHVHSFRGAAAQIYGQYLVVPLSGDIVKKSQGHVRVLSSYLFVCK
jgi:hypothetical protein